MSDALSRVAAAYGVATEYWDWQGQHVQVADDTLRAVLAALDVDASTDDAAEAALHELDQAAWRRVLPHTVVLREGWTPWVPVHVPHGSPVALRIETEDGASREATQVEHWVAPRQLGDVLVGEATFELPGDLPLGYHRLVAEFGGEHSNTASALLIVTPAKLELPEGFTAPAWGLQAQLYQARSRHSWGIGDLHDLGSLARYSASLGGDYVMVNPLHAAQPIVPVEASPYLPTTRRFANPIYLRIEDIPEIEMLGTPDRVRIANLASEARRLTGAEFIDRDGSWTRKREALDILFTIPLRPSRASEFLAFRTQEGEGLERFATWCALAEVHGAAGEQWGADYADPESPAVAAFRTEHADRVQFYAWLQWHLRQQLAAAQAAAREAGMSLGVLHDLAVGVHSTGADRWGLGDYLAEGIEVGAPPDQFNQIGQNWSQPPWRPDALARGGYAPFRDLARTVLRDSGGIRVDHIIGLFRLWWIPLGATPGQGTYVTYDAEALIGILALEAHRAGAIVIGEDLGVVAPEVRDVLRERGILGTSILWFEWGDDGAPLAPEQYRELCMSTVTTHDLPPTAGYLALAHVDVRGDLGLLTRSVDEERAVEQASIDAFLGLARDRGDLSDPATIDDEVVALHALIARTPSVLRGVALADLVGDRRAVNQPGTDKEYPNWRVPLTDVLGRHLLIDDLVGLPLAQRIADAIEALPGADRA